MQTRYFQFDAFRTLFEPRKPRNPLVRVALGLLGLAILALMVFVGVFVGTAMILVGLGWNLFAARKVRRARAAAGNVVDAEYHVVRKSALPLAR
ncbi:hypothetical protein [Stenotrophomonas sp. YIM B06876]|uniref:hypothetical protein n=1 Tax=Stenotrophomonas sp. YIM B06876 TaxID=3060211 RepID=UPI0027386149|nr:hypothetical protein [Stenotrophomonas sp. YIM B06876]